MHWPSASIPGYGWDDIVLPTDLMRRCARSPRRSLSARQSTRAGGSARGSPRAAASPRCSAARAARARRWPPKCSPATLRPRPLPHRPGRRGQQVHRRDREEPPAASSTPPSRAARSCFFDEADALFGKRSEVKDSHDRYANIEVNYLLQRMEDYRGLAILATNLKTALDQAFLRRLRFVVEFPFPDAEQRAAIWQTGLPAGRRRPERLDFDALARLERHRRQHPQHRAQRRLPRRRRGRADRAWSTCCTRRRREYAKIDKLLTEAEFGAHYYKGNASKSAVS